jgi:hypothetical protein
MQLTPYVPGVCLCGVGVRLSVGVCVLCAAGVLLPIAQTFNPDDDNCLTPKAASS